MKFLQLITLPPEYLARFYASHPDLLDAGCREQERALVHDACDPFGIWTGQLAEAGHETRLVIANNIHCQLRWARDKGIKLKSRNDWIRELAIEQVVRFKPDVLCLADLNRFDMKFVRRIRRQPRMIIGWHRGPVTDSMRWEGMDLLLSPYPYVVQKAWRKRVRDAAVFQPGFSRWIAESVFQEPQVFDLVFVGQWSKRHSLRNKLLIKIAKASLRTGRPFNFRVFLHRVDDTPVPDVLQKLDCGPRFGIERYRALQSGRMAICAPSDTAHDSPITLSVLEATGLGLCALAPRRDGLSRYFIPGSEILDYESSEALVKQIDAMLANEQKRNEIARAGQERCLIDHTMDSAMLRLRARLDRRPSRLGSWMKRTWHRLQR